MCAALAYGRLDEEAFRGFEDVYINLLMKKCSIIVDSGYEESYKKGLQPAKVEIVLHDGTTIAESLPDVPWLDSEEVTARFTEEVSRLWSGEKTKGMLHRYQHLDDLVNSGELIKMLA